MTELNRIDSDEIRSLVEDSVEYACDQAFKEGRFLSGETAWTVVWALATAKMAEFEGLVEAD